MNVAIYSTHKFEMEYLENANNGQYNFKYITIVLSSESTHLAEGCEAISIFVSDDATASVLHLLKKIGVKFLALRSAGYNHVDIGVAKKLNIKVARVAEYSPFAVAEHAVALILALNRKLIRAHNRVMEQNFSLDGLVGFDMNGKTVGIIGTGKIGSVAAKILHGFGCKILVHDQVESEELKQKYNVTYVDYETLCKQSDIITLHVPLTEKTKHIINKGSIEMMKDGVMLINTSRGKLVHTNDVIDALKSGHIGSFGMDVYEEEEGLFFEDHSEEILKDDTIARLMSFRNVLITSHQAFLTDTALKNIADTTVKNLECFEKNTQNKNEI